MELTVGSIVDGKVTGIMKFGAFVSLPEGRSGLVHISEIAYTYVSEVSDFLKVGQEVKVKVIHAGVGAISESDVMLASASNSVIIGFNVRPDATAKTTAENEKVDVRLYRVIYNAIEDIQAAMKGMLDPEFVEKQLGHAEVRQVFKASGIGTIAGSYVTDGKITRSAKARLIRDSIVIYEGEMDSLRRFKDDVREVAAGYECGIMLNKFSDIKEGDVIEAFVMEEVER